MKTAVGAIAAALVLAGGTGAFAAPQMYKCVENGHTVYQQQACNPQPPGEPPTASASHVPAAAASEAAPAATKKLRRPAPASSAPATPR